MDEDEFKETYLSLNTRVCPYEKVILSRQCDCRHAARLFIAERQAVGCDTDAPQQRCVAVLDAMRSKAAFALKLTSATNRLPHAKEMKVQAGGLRGLQRALQPAGGDAPIEDIDGLLRLALDTYGSLQQLPYSELMQSIVAYEGRRRGGKGGQ